MEDQSQQEQTQVTPPQATAYSVSQTKQKSGGSKWLIIFIILLILGGAGIYFFTKSAAEPIATPTPSFNVTPIEDKATSTPVATKSPEPTKKDEVSIEIQNGTGITGEAKLLSDKLKALGYSDITAGNAPTTDNTATTVTFSKSLSQSIQDELKKELESFYKEVNVKTSSTQKSDVVIITGLRASQTSKPAASATPKSTGATATPSASPKATSSASPSN
ncbi:MAG: LytR C-terminal domain-containing protein [Microgenomates group bacterium]